MQKKLDLVDFSIPLDDIDCWHRYPKHRWVYETTRLLDAQNIHWSPFPIDEYIPIQNIRLSVTNKEIYQNIGLIYTKPFIGKTIINEVYILKGEIKLFKQYDDEQKEIPIEGNIELKINAFVILHFSKFTGVVQFITNDNVIVSVKLRPNINVLSVNDNSVVRAIRKIYKRTDSVSELTINGLSDQVLHESVAS